MRLKRNNPWNPRYAYPANVLAETGRFARVTPSAPRGTYDDPEIPDAWSPHYALPGNVRAERPGQGVNVSPGLPRGYGGDEVPSEFAASALEGWGSLGATPPPKLGKLAKGQRAVGGKLTLGGSSDPIANFGKSGAAAVIAAAKSLPPGDRRKALRAMLDAVDPSMWGAVEQKLNAQKKRGVTPAGGIQGAVAAALANHFAKQVREVGKTGKLPLNGVIGLGYYDEDQAHAHQVLGSYVELGWNPFSSVANAIGGAVTSIGSGIKKGVVATGEGIVGVTKATGRGIASAAKATGNAIADAAKATYNAAKKGLNALGDLACLAANSGLLKVAAQGAGMATGGPGGAAAGGTGADLVAGMCAPGGPGAQALVPQTPAPPSTGMSTTTMLLIGGGALGLLLLVK